MANAGVSVIKRKINFTNSLLEQKRPTFRPKVSNIIEYNIKQVLFVGWT